MHSIDLSIILIYLIALPLVGIFTRLRKDSTPSELIVGGRMLTLPAFVASIVSTWYGGILGVGEFTYLYGISNWLVFGLPYYLAAFLFATFLAKKARNAQLLTIPERLEQTYDKQTALIGSTIIFFMTVPAAYIVMLGVLCESFFGWPYWTGVIVGTSFSVGYVYLGGFRSVVRTDLIQFFLMFVGFAILLIVLITNYGGYEFLSKSIPSMHLTWHGGNSGLYIASWYVIALATLIEPAFYQRCFAARSEKTARNGIFVAILFWVLFDFMTTSVGLYAKALLPNLSDPVASFPELALTVLPVGLLGLFALSLLATVMSTVDSYTFIAATTYSRDLIGRWKQLSDRNLIIHSRIGLTITTIIAVLFALIFRSAVDIWYLFGSIGTPALLIPVFFSFVGKRRMPPFWAKLSVILSGLTALGWYLSKYLNEPVEFWLSIDPIFPGMIVSITIFLFSSRSTSEQLP